jgi:hypothetical protein
MSTAAIIETLTAVALHLPNVEEHIDGEHETREFKTKDVTFFVLGKTTLRLKLHESLEEARKMAATSHDHRYELGADGWVTVTFGEKPPPIPTLRHWISESHRVCGTLKP